MCCLIVPSSVIHGCSVRRTLYTTVVALSRTPPIDLAHRESGGVQGASGGVWLGASPSPGALSVSEVQYMVPHGGLIKTYMYYSRVIVMHLE